MNTTMANSFFNEVLDGVNAVLPEDVSGSLSRVRKNNGVTLDGIVIRKDGSPLSPTIYLNEYLPAYQDGRSTIDEVVDSVLAAYKASRTTDDVGSFLQYADWESVKYKIYFRLVNRRMNEELLADVPHEDFLDLAVTFHVMVSIHEEGDASILIRNDHLQMWGVTEEDLMQEARANMPRLLPAEAVPLASILAGLVGDEAADAGDGGLPMYIITNRQRLHGSGAVLYGDALAVLADRLGSDLWLLPSSIHEWIAVPVSMGADAMSLAAMISEVNESTVSEQDILSDHPYLYHLESGKITVA